MVEIVSIAVVHPSSLFQHYTATGHEAKYGMNRVSYDAVEIVNIAEGHPEILDIGV